MITSWVVVAAAAVPLSMVPVAAGVELPLLALHLEEVGVLFALYLKYMNTCIATLWNKLKYNFVKTPRTLLP